MKFNLGQDSEAMFGQDFKLKYSGDADVWLRFLSLCFRLCFRLTGDDNWIAQNIVRVPQMSGKNAVMDMLTQDDTAVENCIKQLFQAEQQIMV